MLSAYVVAVFRYCDYSVRQFESNGCVRPELVASALVPRPEFAERLGQYDAGIVRIARVEDVPGRGVGKTITSHSRLARSALRPGPISAVRRTP